jgi:hypothetical protein
MKSIKKEKWEDEFDVMWSELQEVEIMGNYGGGIGIWEDEKVKDFIRKTLSSQRHSLLKEIKEKIEKMKIHEMKNVEGCQAFTDKCGKKDKKGRFICEYCRMWNGQDREELSEKSIYTNQALSEVLKILG